MEDRVSVGTSYQESGFVSFAVLASLGILGGLTLMFFNPTAAAIVGGIGLLFALLAFVRGLIVARGRRWMTPNDDGFLYEDRNGEFEFRDEDIVELGTWAKLRYSNGVPKSVQRDGTFALSAGGLATDLKYSYTFPVGKPDPLDEFLERNIARITILSAGRIEAGEPLVGEGWELDKNEIVVTANRVSDAYSLEQLTACEVVDNKVNIWIRGEPKPVVKIPAGTINALVLLRVLNKRFVDRGTKSDEDEPGLGRIIFERDRSISKAICILSAIFGGLLCLGGLAAAFAATQERDPVGPAVVAVALLLVGAGIALGVWFNRINIFRCHVRGVCRITTKTQKQLEYKDVHVFSYSAIRQYVNGGYTGTTMSMTFEPIANSELEKIVYSTTMKTIDAELDNLRDHVSGVIAHHMKLRIEAGEDVKWTEGLQFTPKGLELKIAGGILSKAKHRVLPYERCAVTLHEGYFFLFERGEKDSLYSIPVSAPNFFPGYALVCLLAYPPRPSEADRELIEKIEEIPRIKPKSG